MSGRSLMARIRSDPLEAILLTFAFAAIGFTGAQTAVVALAGDRDQDLTFSGATEELARTLSVGRASRVATLDRARSNREHGPVVDTIAIAADSAEEPATAVGGFIHDQVARYNDEAIREAVRSAADDRGSDTRSKAGDGFGAASRGLLQTAWTDDGRRILSDQPNPYGLVIRSPYAERRWREVRTSDWRSSPSLLGYDGDVSLASDRPAGVFQARLNGHDCAIDRDAPQFYLYCGSALALDAKRFYDVRFQTTPNDNGGSFLSAGSYRPRTLWRNGKSESFGQRSVTGGDVFDVAPLGPFILSAADWGTLAAAQWINGRSTFANPNVGTLSFFAAAGRAVADQSGSTGPLVLSFDARLSTDLDRESARFLTAHGGELRRMAVVVLDARTGEVKAISEPARRSNDEPLLSFDPVLVGSVVKPIMASAILSRHPELGDLRISYAGDTVSSVGGVELDKPFENEANGCGGEIGFTDFIRCSSNQYAAELMVRSLEQDGFGSRTKSASIPRTVLEHSAIATGLADLFDVDASAGRTSGRLGAYWNASADTTSSALLATTDRGLFPYESRPWLLFPDSSGTRVDWIARYAFGGWENRWTLLGLAQAYARIATGRNVQATFLRRPATTTATSPFAAASPAATTAFGRVRTALRQVGISGTAAGLSDAIHKSIDGHVVVLAKTGTLNERAAGIRLKSLALAVGLPQPGGDAAPLGCGLVAVTYFEFSDDVARGDRTALPRIHRDFAEGPLAGALARHWTRVSGCTNGPGSQHFDTVVQAASPKPSRPAAARRQK